MIELDKIRADKLVKLAHDHFKQALYDAEVKVLHDSASSIDPHLTKVLRPYQQVRAEFIRWLATAPETEQLIDSRGIRVGLATITGSLDLRECRVHSVLIFYRCIFKKIINLQSAKTQSVLFPHSELVEGIVADRATIHGFLFFGKAKSWGEISLAGARIEGDVDFNYAKLYGPCTNVAQAGAASSNNGQSEEFKRSLEYSLQLAYQSSMTFITHGTVNLIGATITGGLMFTGTSIEGLMPPPAAQELTAPSADSKIAIVAIGTKIGGTVFFNQGFTAYGEITFISARIGRYVAFINAKVEKVNCMNIQIDGDFYWRGITYTQSATLGSESDQPACVRDQKQKGIPIVLNLTGAKLKRLVDDKDSWPKPEEGKLALAGLNYEDLSLHDKLRRDQKTGLDGDPNEGHFVLNEKERIGWIMKQSQVRQSEPQPWMQLRDLLEKKGEHRKAKYVFCWLRCLQARVQPRYPHAQSFSMQPASEVNRGWFRGITRSLWVGSTALIKDIKGIFLYHWLPRYAKVEEQPLRILGSIAFFVALGTVIFAGAIRSNGDNRSYGDNRCHSAMIQTIRLLPSYENDPNRKIPESYPPFNPFIYSLENSLPLVKLGMDDRWMPNRDHVAQPWFPRHHGWHWLEVFNWYWFLAFTRWGLILSGWVQATVLVSALSERFKK